MSVAMLCCVRPTCVEHLAAMEEVAEEKARKYGAAFTSLIRSFCEETHWTTDVMPGEVVVTAKVRREVTGTARLIWISLAIPG